MNGVFTTTRFPFALIVTSAILLTACENLPEQLRSKTTEAAQTGGTLSLEERDVEAPDVFDVKDKAIWDGLPSFGGVWVAYPGNERPERVTITNEENGKNVVGALFKREAENPGPPLTVSSDAAAALGIVPGQPTLISVRALRREAVEVPGPAVTPGAIEEVSETTLAPLAAPTESDDALVTEIEGVLDGTAPPKKSPLAPALKAGTPAPEVPTQQSANRPSRPYLQVATFSSQTNADAMVKKLAGVDVPGSVKSRKMNNGKTLFLVLAGPANSTEEFQTMSGKVSSIGIKDAFPVSN